MTGHKKYYGATVGFWALERAKLDLFTCTFNIVCVCFFFSTNLQNTILNTVYRVTSGLFQNTFRCYRLPTFPKTKQCASGGISNCSFIIIIIFHIGFV